MVRYAIIFDIDVLMLDTERLWMHMLQRAAVDLDFTIPDALYLSTIGRTIDDALTISIDHFGAGYPFFDLRTKRLEYEREYAAQYGLPTKPGLEDVLQFLDTHFIPKTVATSSARDRAHWKLHMSRLVKHCDIVVGGDDVTHGKPAPDLFPLASERLQVAPTYCIVLEDSSPGIRAARHAGMILILVPDLQL